MTATEIGGDHRYRSDNCCVFDAPAYFWPILVHESAHATIGQRLGLVVKRIEVIIDGDRLDATTVIDYSKARLSNYLTVLLAGEAAEEEVFGQQVLPRVHAGSDRERLYLAVAKAGPMGQQELTVARQKAARLVRCHRRTILGMASELLAMADGAGVVVDGDALTGLLDADGSAILRLAAI